MSDRNIQHPDITESWRTGEMWSPIRSSIVECSICGCEMVLNSITREPVCEECLKVMEMYRGEEPA